MVRMTKISINELKDIAKKYDLKPCKVKDAEVVNIRKHPNPRMDDIIWDEFERILKKRKLAVYKSDNDFLKIMRDK